MEFPSYYSLHRVPVLVDLNKQTGLVEAIDCYGRKLDSISVLRNGQKLNKEQYDQLVEMAKKEK